MNKEVILINPDFKEKLNYLNIPMGCLHIGSYLSFYNYKVSILDANNFRQIKDFNTLLVSKLNNALCVGLSVMSSQIPGALRISRYIKQHYPTIPIIWGGVHPTLYPEQTIRSDYVDFVVIGEGEKTAFELIAALKAHTDYSEIEGIAFINTNNNEPTLTGKRNYCDMNALPPIQWTLLSDIKEIQNMAEVDKLTIAGIPLQTSRGCPYRCTFCINSVLKEKYRFKDVDLVLNEIETLVTSGVKRIYFRDELFFSNNKRLIKIVEGIEQRNLVFKWFGTVRSDYYRKNILNYELLKRLKKNGCSVVGIGAESGSQRILDLLNKKITTNDILKTAGLLNKVGIKTNFSFMIGLPGEEQEDMRKTLRIIQKISRINNNFIVLGPQIYRPYPGSELYLHCKEAGMKEPESLTDWESSAYIEADIQPKDKHLYPWIRYPIKYLHNIVFYTYIMCRKSRFPLLTWIIHRIAEARCKAFFFKFPIEKKLYELFKKLRINDFIKS